MQRFFSYSLYPMILIALGVAVKMGLDREMEPTLLVPILTGAVILLCWILERLLPYQVEWTRPKGDREAGFVFGSPALHAGWVAPPSPLRTVRLLGRELSARVASAAVLAPLLVLAVDKARVGVLWEMAWNCHIASAGICLGLALRHPGLLAGGLVYCASYSMPSFAVFVWTGGTSAPLSWLAHFVPPALGVLYAPPTRWTAAAGGWAGALMLVAFGLGTVIAHNWGHAINLAVVPVELPGGGSIGPIRLWGLPLVVGYLMGARWLLAAAARRVLATGSTS